MNFLSYFKGPSSQDQQKTIRRRLITSKVTLTGHLMLIFVLRKVTLPNRIISVPWWTDSHQLRTMNVRNWPKNPLVKLNESDLTESANCVLSWYGVGVTAFIHCTELMWPRAFMVRNFCVHCTVVIHLADFFHNIKNPPILIHKNTALIIMTCKTGATLSESTKVTLRS